jgi:hypothetical protein
MSKERKSFIVYYTTYETLKDFKDAELGKIFRAMCEYDINGVETALPKHLQIAFNFIKAHLDADKKKYKEKCEKNKLSAEKRWEEKNANVCERMRTHKKNAYIDNDIDNDIDIDIDNINIINKTRQDKTRKRVCADSFLETEDKNYVDSLCLIIDEVESMKDDEAIIIGGNRIKAQFVKDVFNKIDFFVFQYAVNKCKSISTDVVKTKPYLRTLLYNAYFEMNPQIQEEVKKIFPLRRVSNEL